ncbi:MAG: UDP-glucose dehydrogenase family protein [Chitinophagaceae bacterium]
MNITVIGTGYVGLVTGTCLAEKGNKVVCVDIDSEKISSLSQGVMPIYETDLKKLVMHNIAKERLSFTTSLSQGVTNAKVIFFALPTPPDENGSADLSYVLDVSQQLIPLLKKYTVIINKSTVPVGTTQKIYNTIKKGYTGSFDVVSNPEFLKEGSAVADFMNPDRIVVGTLSKKAKKVMDELYLPFTKQGIPLLFMDECSSELTKYAANTFLAMKIAFINEIAQLCEKMGADVSLIKEGIGYDDRIGQKFLNAGIGFGGSCFPKDVTALLHTAKQSNYDFKLVKALIDVNQVQKVHLVKPLKSYFKNYLVGKKIALWGLSYKPETDDIREAPSLYIINALLEEGVSIQVYDPKAIENIQKIYKNKINYFTNKYDALTNADALMIISEWKEFKTADLKKIGGTLRQKVIFDGRNIYNVETMKKHKFHYVSIGRPSVISTEN